MTERKRLPSRRDNKTIKVTHKGQNYAVTFGYDPATGEVREIFTRGSKVGSQLDGLIDDFCILLSIALQYGIKASSLAGSMGRQGFDNEPSSIFGFLMNLLREQELGK